MFEWNSELYGKFIKERTQPAEDLANRIPIKEAETIIDIGCGPGNSTRVLADKFPNAHIIGADISPEMISNAKSCNPELEFILFNAEKDFDALDKTFDIIFSNACIQWIPDHRRLLKSMINHLSVGGVLAVQTPMNFKEPIHIIIEQLAKSAEWENRFESPQIFHNLSQSEYYDTLAEISSDFNMWETVYFHRMPSHQSIIDWYKGTGLRPYLAALNPNEAKRFESAVLNKVIEAYPAQKNGEIIFRFPRLFFTAIK